MRFFSAGLTWSGQRARLLFIITLIMVCALVVNVTITSSRVHVEATEQIRSTSEVATDLLAKSLAGLVFNFQVEEAGLLLEEFANNPNIVKAEIIDTDGSVLSSAGVQSFANASDYNVERNLTPKGKASVGKLVVTVSGRAFHAAVNDAFWSDVVSGSIQILAILIAVFFGMSKLIGALSQAHDRMRSLASRDQLTGCLNRRGAIETAQRLLRDQTGRKVGFVQLDLDRFKTVNDSLGHATGDKVLLEATNRIRSCLRKQDVVCRIGGDEFLVICPFDDDTFSIYEFANRLLRALSKPLPKEVCRVRVGASAGMTDFELHSMEDFDKAMAATDLALYEAKNTGRQRAVSFREEMKDNFTDNEQLLEDLHRALERQEFEPWFQPQIDCQSGKAVGVEALVRWRSPRRGLVAPGLFLKVAEEAGLLAEIDRQVFDKSFIALAAFREAGLRDLRLSLNLSTSLLESNDIVNYLKLRVMSNALKPHDISLEILETIFLDEPEEKSSSTIRQLQEAGFRIELDDFGTGRTSIANLTKFPVSKLKIDRHFIQNIDSDSDRQSITRALIGFARELNIEPLAEGVETPEEMNCLQKLGCQAMQGYYFAQPMQLEHAIRWCCERDSGLRPHLVRVA